MTAFDLKGISDALMGATIDPTRWKAALETVARQTRSRGICVLPVKGSAPPIIANTDSMNELGERYVTERWFDRDLRWLGAPSLLKNGAYTDHDCMPAEHRKRSPYYQDFLARSGLAEFAGVRMGRGDVIWNLSIQRTAGQGAFSNAEISELCRLSDSLDAIAEVSAAFGLAKGEAALEAFQFADRAAVLLNRAGKVVRANGAAEALLGPDLQISMGRIVSRDPKATERLHRAIRTLLWTEAAAVVSPIAFPKAAGGKLIVYPMRLSSLAESALSAFHAILVIADTGASRSAMAATLRVAFDLTPAEARLATAIGNGEDITSFALRSRLSRETVRNQLKSVFQKTGTGRQAELAVVLGTLVPQK